ncbi:MAG: NAD-dependent epimerase/dehydratase family protein [Gammaproteobacteria bacterium]|nr:NAD-dependent epimerase/dehydratase family protein [Gammaproteobacteria bacterium]
MTTELRTPETVAVTGASGFLGSHMSERLIAEGCRLRVLARDPGKARFLRDRVDAVVTGDIADPAPLAELARGCDTFVHLVSNFRVVKGAPESYHRTNTEGTRVALAAAAEAGVRRFVHCSTIGVHGDVRSSPADENAPFNPGDLYQETKLLAEHACRESMADTDMEIVIIRPTSQYGPGDLRMLKMFRMLAEGKFVMIGSCQANFHAVYIDDLVDGFLRAMTRPGISGETFLVGGPRYVTLEEYIRTAAAALGAAPPRWHLPYWPVHAAAWTCEALCRPLGIEPPLHRRRVRFFRNNRAFSIDKARRLLGYDPRIDLAEGMRRTVDWYREQGLL